MSILNSHFLMHAHHNFTSFVILYICLSKYKPYRAYVTNLIYSTINKVCLSVCLSRTKLITIDLICFYFPDNMRYIQCIHNNSQCATNLPVKLSRIDPSTKIVQPGYDMSRVV